MLILSFDTTSEHGGVAIYRDTKCLASAANTGTANYSVGLFQMLDRQLEQLTLCLRDIELFAVATGPGSFTGIRVGVAAAQGWAEALKRPVRGISVLEAMVEEAQVETDVAVPILDARRGEFFLSLFQPRASPGAAGCPISPAELVLPVEPRPLAYRPAGGSLVLKLNAVVRLLEQLARADYARRKLNCLAREHDSATEALRDLIPESIAWQEVRGPLVGAIARLALRAQWEGHLQSPAELNACYVRRSDAELNWRE